MVLSSRFEWGASATRAAPDLHGVYAREIEVGFKKSDEVERLPMSAAHTRTTLGFRPNPIAGR